MCERREIRACERVREMARVWEDQVRDTMMGGSYRWGDFQRVSWRGVRDGGLGCIEKDSEDKGEREK